MLDASLVSAIRARWAIAAIALAVVASAPAGAAVLVGVRSATLSWTPSTGPAEGYVVLASRNGGPETAQGYTTTPGFRVVGEFGDEVVVRVLAYGYSGPGGSFVLSAPSQASEPIVFQPATSWPSSDAFALHCGSCGRIRLAVLRAPEFAYEFAALHEPWKPLEIGPVSPNGLSQVVWRNGVTGQLAVTPFDSQSGSTPLALSGTSGMTSREGLGLADLDGDGRQEILVRNASNGYLERWGISSTSLIRLSSHPVPSGWSYVDSHDLDRDGREEIIWQGSVAGDLRVSGWDTGFVATLEQYTTTLPGVPVQVADFDGNGSADVLFQGAMGVLGVAYFDAQGLDSEVQVPFPFFITFIIHPTPVWAEVDGKPGAEIVAQNRSDGSLTALMPTRSGFPSWAKLFDLQPGWKPFSRF